MAGGFSAGFSAGFGSTGVGPNQTVTATGLASTTALGTPGLGVGGIVINAAGYGDIEAFGLPVFSNATVGGARGALFSRSGRLQLKGGRLRLTKASSVTTPTNPAPVDLTLSASNIREASAAGTEIGRIDVTDPGDSTWTWAIESQSTAGLFEVVSQNSGAYAMLRTAATVPAYSTATSHTVTVRVTDPAAGWYHETFTIGVQQASADTLNALLAYIPATQDPAIAEGKAASTSTYIGTIEVMNPDGGYTSGTAYTWSLESQSTGTLFTIGSPATDSTSNDAVIRVYLNQTMPAWSDSVQVHTLTVKATDTGGKYARQTIQVPVARNGAPANLYPLDGYTIYDNQVGKTVYFSARGAVDGSYTYSIVNDTRFSFAVNQLVVNQALTAGTYTITIRVANSKGSADFVRTLTVKSKTDAEKSFPWWSNVQNGPQLPAVATALPQTLRIVNESGSSVATNQYVSFHLAFPKGHISTSERPVFQLGGTTIVPQIDGAKFWYDDAGTKTGFASGRFTLKIPATFTALEIKALTVTKQTGSLTTTEPRTVAAAKSLIAGRGYKLAATLDGTAYAASLTQAELDGALTRQYGGGQHGHGFRVITKFKKVSDSTDHGALAVHWYAWAYDDGRTEIMPVVHNSWMQSCPSVAVTAVSLTQASPSRTYTNWYPSSFTHYGHSMWYAGDANARPYLDDGTANALFADYSQCLDFQWEAGVWHRYKNDINPAAPNPASPAHTPGGRPFFVDDPNVTDGPLASGNNYGWCFGTLTDWGAKLIMTGSAAWLNVNRALCADWGVYGFSFVDSTTGEIRPPNLGLRLGSGDTNRYTGLTCLPHWQPIDYASTGAARGGTSSFTNWNNEHFAPPYFALAWTTGRMWWVDAQIAHANYGVAQVWGSPSTSNYGVRLWQFPGSKVYFAPTFFAAERNFAWQTVNLSHAEFLCGDDDKRYPALVDMIRDPYAAAVEWLVNDTPRVYSDNTGPYYYEHRSRGWFFQRVVTWQAWEADYVASAITQDVRRQRWWLKPYVNKWACYLLPTLTYGRAAPASKGGAGCSHYMWLNDCKHNGTFDSTVGGPGARTWQEIALINNYADFRVNCVGPGPVPTVNGQPAWYGVSYTYCRSGTSRDAFGGFNDGTRPKFQRGAAVMGTHAGIPNAADALAACKGAKNYSAAPATYATDFARWYIVE